MKINLSLFNIEIGIIASARKKRTETVKGITNRCDDGHYILFLDYDNIPYEWLKEELKALQVEFSIKELFILKSSSDSYHIISFEKFTREEYEQILHRSSCDKGYKTIPFIWGKKLNTLRITEKNGKKPEFFDYINYGGLIMNREISKAHSKMFKLLYDLNPIGNKDNSENIIFAEYKI